MILTVLTFLKLKTDGTAVLQEEHKLKLEAEYGKEFSDEFVQAYTKDPVGAKTEDSTVTAMINAMQSKLSASLEAQRKLESDLTAEKTAKDQFEAIVTEQKATITLLTKKPEEDPNPKIVPMKGENKKWVPTGKDTHLFGIEATSFAMDDKHPFNVRAYAKLMERQGISFAAPMAVSSLDYSSLTSDLGDYYRTRNQRGIQSFLMSLPTIANTIFNLESGYQDQSVLVNMWLDELSQADNTSSSFDNVVKGGYKFEPEIITMYDVMFAHKFTDLKALEKQWIGDLNREGSSTMKWSFVEYVMVESGKQLKNEQEIRWLKGVRKNPTANVPGTSLQASNGLLKFIKNEIALFKIKPFTVGEWTVSTIANYIYNSTKLIPAVLRDSGKLVLYMSVDALSSYHKNLEVLYGLNQDYKPNISYVKEYPGIKIVAIPNLGESKRMIWTIEGNIALFEDKPGEMLNFNFEQQDWTLKVWSNWKESVWAYRTGKKFASAAAMPSDYSTQMIFCNDVDEPADYYINMDANDTTPSVLNHTSLVSVANTQATALTNIDDAVVGTPIRLKCGNVTNGVTIAASGNFSLLTAAWTPAVGDELWLIKRSDGKFVEINRVTITTDATAFTADDTTPDVTGHIKFITVTNSVATAITALDNAVTGVDYTIYGGSSTNAATIANSGNFSLTAAMTLSAGTFIVLRKSAVNGKLYEISRG